VGPVHDGQTDRPHRRVLADDDREVEGGDHSGTSVRAPDPGAEDDAGPHLGDGDTRRRPGRILPAHPSAPAHPDRPRNADFQPTRAPARPRRPPPRHRRRRQCAAPPGLRTPPTKARTNTYIASNLPRTPRPATKRELPPDANTGPAPPIEPVQAGPPRAGPRRSSAATARSSCPISANPTSTSTSPSRPARAGADRSRASRPLRASTGRGPTTHHSAPAR